MCRSVDVLTSDAAYHSVRTGVSPPPWSARPSPSVLAALFSHLARPSLCPVLCRRVFLMYRLAVSASSMICGGGIICGVRLRRRPTYAFSVEPPDGSIEDRGERNPRQVGEEQHGSQTA
jgi:hypothetical protein